MSPRRTTPRAHARHRLIAVAFCVLAGTTIWATADVPAPGPATHAAR